MTIPLVHPPQLNGAASVSASAPAPVPFSWEHDRMLNVYILDYFIKHGFAKAARELTEEADLHDPNNSKPPIDAKQGLLYEWWVVFWEIFQAKSSPQGKPDPMLYIEHTNRARASAAQIPNGIPQNAIQQPGIANPNMQARPMIAIQGHPGQARPPNAPGGPLPGQVIVNGTPGPHHPQQPGQMPNGAIPPGQPGSTQFQVPPGGQQMVNGVPTSVTPMPPQVPSNVGPPGAPGVPPHLQPGGRPAQFASPVMSNQQHPGGPMRQAPPTPAMRQASGSGMMGMAGMPPPQHPGIQGVQNVPYAPRPGTPSATTPSAMRGQQSSPPMAPMHPEQWKADWPGIKAQLTTLQEGHYKMLREQAGIPDKQDLNTVNDDQARAMVGAYKAQIQQQRMTASSPRNPDQVPPQLRRGAKRASTSPGDEDMNKELSPPSKRLRPTPPMSASEPPGLPVMNLGGGPQINGAMGQRPPQMGGIPNGMHPGHPQNQGIPPGMSPVNPMHMQPMPGQVMVQGPQGPMLIRATQPGMPPPPGHPMGPGGPGGPQLAGAPGGQNSEQLQRQAAEYRQNLAAIHNKFPGQMYNIAPQDGPGVAGPSTQSMNASMQQQQQRLQQQAPKQPFGTTGVMAPPGSPASKPMMPPQAPTPKEENNEQQQQQQQQQQHQQQQQQQQQQMNGGVEAPSPSPGRQGFHHPQPTNPNAPQPYPPVEPRAASTPANGMQPQNPVSQPSPAQQQAPPPPPSSAPPTMTPALSTPAGLGQPIFDLQNNEGIGSWDFNDPLSSMSMGMGIGMDFGGDDFTNWINPDPGGDMIGGV